MRKASTKIQQAAPQPPCCCIACNSRSAITTRHAEGRLRCATTEPARAGHVAPSRQQRAAGPPRLLGQLVHGAAQGAPPRLFLLQQAWQGTGAGGGEEGSVGLVGQGWAGRHGLGEGQGAQPDTAPCQPPRPLQQPPLAPQKLRRRAGAQAWAARWPRCLQGTRSASGVPPPRPQGAAPAAGGRAACLVVRV